MDHDTRPNDQHARNMAAHPWRLLATAANFRRAALQHPAGSFERRDWIHQARGFVLCSSLIGSDSETIRDVSAAHAASKPSKPRKTITEGDLLAGYRRNGGAS